MPCIGSRDTARSQVAVARGDAGNQQERRRGELSDTGELQLCADALRMFRGKRSLAAGRSFIRALVKGGAALLAVRPH